MTIKEFLFGQKPVGWDMSSNNSILKRAEDIIAPKENRANLERLWRMGYEIGFCEKAFIPATMIPVNHESDITYRHEELLLGDLKSGWNQILGRNHGQEYRELNASHDPVTRYFESVATLSSPEIGHSLALQHLGNIEEELLLHVRNFDNSKLAALLRDRRGLTTVVHTAIQKESTARILESL